MKSKPSAPQRTDGLYAHPFSRAYWRDAADEFKNTRTLIFAALMIALRVIFKAVKIPIGPYLSINTAFLINAMGAMSFGPAVAAAAAAVTDTLGYLLFPDGPYYILFIIPEIVGSMIFALLLYRTRVSVWRVLLARFLVAVLVNLVIQTPIFIEYYRIFYPTRFYAVFDIPRIIKNLALFPFEALALVLFLQRAMPPLERLGVMRSRSDGLTFTRRHVTALVCLSVFSVGIFVGGSIWLHNTRSLSAEYSNEQRIEANADSLARVLAQDPSLADTETVAVVDSAFRPFLSDKTTWTVAVYAVNAEKLEEMHRTKIGVLRTMGLDRLADKVEAAGADIWGDRSAFRGYSKSPAKKHPALRPLYTCVIVTDGSGQVLSFEKKK